MLKKAGIIVAAVATGVLAVSSVAFADTSTDNVKNDCTFGNVGGTPTGTAGGGGQQDSGARTGAERDYSDPATGPLIGEQHDTVEGVGEQQEELEQRIRTNIGEDPRTAEMPRVNVEVNDGVAELRGVAPSEDAKLAAGEIAQAVEGVREVRNLITVS